MGVVLCNGFDNSSFKARVFDWSRNEMGVVGAEMAQARDLLEVRFVVDSETCASEGRER